MFLDRGDLQIERFACDLEKMFSSTCRHLKTESEILVSVIQFFKRDRINSQNVICYYKCGSSNLYKNEYIIDVWSEL